MSAIAPPLHANSRILVIDDNRAIHEDFRKILLPAVGTSALDETEAMLFGETRPVAAGRAYTIDSAYQGEEGLGLIRAAVQRGEPYAMAFVDMRMPPGWDGLETVCRIWNEYPDLEVVICTAYADYSWEEIIARVGNNDRLLILKKPFDTIEVRQLANALTEKWALRRDARCTVEDLQIMVRARTEELLVANDRLRAEMMAREAAEVALRHAQKLEAVGRLASGLAHELNTPIQYAGDNAVFVRSASRELLHVVSEYRDAHARVVVASPELAQAIEETEKTLDIPDIERQLPDACNAVVEGISRVAGIVRAMTQFGRRDGREQQFADLNDALRNTLTVAASEYREIAEIRLELGDIPYVLCYVGELNQVFLNVLVNAAHAVALAERDRRGVGVITVRTYTDGDDVVVEISDTGTGIAEDIQDKVFEPFFTTKEVGSGTGQGLAICRAIVVDQHGGSISFTTAPGKGTTFFVRVPVEGCLARR